MPGVLIIEETSGIFLFDREWRGRTVLVQLWAMVDYWVCRWDSIDEIWSGTTGEDFLTLTYGEYLAKQERVAYSLPDPDRLCAAAQFWETCDGNETLLDADEHGLDRDVYSDADEEEGSLALVERGGAYRGGSGLTLLDAYPTDSQGPLVKALRSRQRLKKRVYKDVASVINKADMGWDAYLRLDSGDRWNGRIAGAAESTLRLEKAEGTEVIRHPGMWMREVKRDHASFDLGRIDAIWVAPAYKRFRRSRPRDTHETANFRDDDGYARRHDVTVPTSPLLDALCQACSEVVTLPWRTYCPACRSSREGA